jgi:hypothetical protein
VEGGPEKKSKQEWWNPSIFRDVRTPDVGGKTGIGFEQPG